MQMRAWQLDGYNIMHTESWRGSRTQQPAGRRRESMHFMQASYGVEENGDL